MNNKEEFIVSDILRVRTMEFQCTESDGTPYLEKSYGFMVYNCGVTVYVDSFDSLEERNEAIKPENLKRTFEDHIDCDVLELLKETLEYQGGMEINLKWIPKEDFWTDDDF